jgi:preprotein translocase subunit YajC
MRKLIRQMTVVFFSMGISVLAWADTAAVVPAGSAASAAAPQQPGFGSMMLPMAAMFGVIYFLMIRPQQKKMKEQQEMLNALKHGDEVVTTSGILGTITGITEKVVTVEVADKVRVKMLKSQVSQVVKGQLKDLAT